MSSNGEHRHGPSAPSLTQYALHHRRRLILFVGCFFLVYLVFFSRNGVPQSVATPAWDASKYIINVVRNRGGQQKPIQHPIPGLMADAQANFKKMMIGQSRSLGEAVEVYKKRYGRDPPNGFDGWWKFCHDNQVRIIDEYDSLVADLEPFWSMSGAELRRRASQVAQLPSVDLVRLESGKAITFNIQKGFNDSEVSARAKGFRLMIEKFQDKLPDMDFPINAKSEGRILVPWEHLTYPNLTHQDSSQGVEAMLGGPFVPDWRGESNVWEAYRRTCHPSTQARRLFGSLRPLKQDRQPVNHLETAGIASGPTSDFNFVNRVDDNFSFCDFPWARYQQGHFFSDWRTIPVLYPIFSPAKAAGFGDILIPSHYYYSSTKRYTYGWDPVNMAAQETDDHEVPWHMKTEKVFWRGATTGGGSSPPGFLQSYQRHRFIRMASDQSDENNRTVVFADPPGGDHFVHAKVPVSQLNEEMMDAAFTKAVGCQQYDGGCEGIRKDHRFADAVPLGEHWKYKYLVDFDGMGYSARLFAFLASESAVIKSTVYREFYSDWIQPWLHYIPLSSSYQEIYNIHAYFSGASDTMLKAANSSSLNSEETQGTKHRPGDLHLRRIARAGRQWKNSIGRKVDMEAYVYRLCLEYARLWSDDREAMSFVLGGY